MTRQSPPTESLAAAILAGDAHAGRRLCHSLVLLRPDNLVQRPWGGRRLPEQRGQGQLDDLLYGEAFELSAWPQDEESAAHPSIAVLSDGSELPLPRLLAALGPRLLGPSWIERFGPAIPLLPKTLDVCELLSVQAHPPGQPELYLVLSAEPGATVRLGFRQDLDPARFQEQLQRGLQLQAQLTAALQPQATEAQLQAALAPWMRQRDAPLRELLPALEPLVGPVQPALLQELRSIAWLVLDALHAIPVEPGMLLYNRQLAVHAHDPALPSADVHALGNPEGREVLLLEVRCPGSTWRAWDHARFPRRRTDLEQVLAALPLRATPRDFYTVEPVTEQPGLLRSVSNPLFAVHQLRPQPERPVSLPPADGLRSLHGIRGQVQVQDAHGRSLAILEPGGSALVPHRLGPLRFRSAHPHAEVLLVSVPPPPEPTASIESQDPPPQLRFGTSGLRGLVRHMTDQEVALNTRGFLRYLEQVGDLGPGDPLAIAEDLRASCSDTGIPSSPRIARAVGWACRQLGHPVVHCGRVPTPALAHWAALDRPQRGKRPMPAIMITGSHIPPDRNGVKFYRLHGEVLKADEPGILEQVRQARAEQAALEPAESCFDAGGWFRAPPADEPHTPAASSAYRERYLEAFGRQRPLQGCRLLYLQHSAVGRDLLPSILQELGAELSLIGRTDEFVAIDTENVGPEDAARFAALAAEHRPFAILSTDGDSDRPLVVDESGRFHRGDVLGLVTAELLRAGYAAISLSTTDALERRLEQRAAAGHRTMAVERTRIGSPHVIAAMQAAIAAGQPRVVGWETNGGFLVGSPLELPQGTLAPLPTRDALLPIIAVLVAARRRQVPLSQLFAELPQRATGAALIDGVPVATSQAVLAALRPAPGEPPTAIGDAFAQIPGLGEPREVDQLDGLRVRFASGEIVHLRPSGNAPQLRAYAVADSDARVQALLEATLGAPQGVVARLIRQLDT